MKKQTEKRVEDEKREQKFIEIKKFNNLSIFK